MIGELSGQDAAIIIGACAAFVVSILGGVGALIKLLNEIRKQTSETNRTVNNRPHSEPTLRELVEQIDERVDRMTELSHTRHESNVHRIDRLSTAVDAQGRKMDRLGDAIAGANRRIENIERNQGDT